MNEQQVLKRYLKNIGVHSMFSNTPNSFGHNEEYKVLLESKTIQPLQNKQVEHANISNNALSVLQTCKTLEDLYELIHSFDGCELKKTALNTVVCDGVKNSKIMIIGEAPGADEDEQGKPFVGKSGQLVDKMFQTIGLSRKENLYITNMVFWRPPGNRPPTDEELALCYPFLKKHIELFNPKIIILLGGVSAKIMLNTKVPVMKLRGQMNEYYHSDLNKTIPLFCFYHPAYLLRSPKQKGLFWQDLLFLKNYIDNNIR